MRAPALLAQCIPGLVPHDKAGHGASAVSDKDLHIPSPAVEIIPAKNAHPYKYVGENVELHGLNVFKGKISVADMVRLNKSPERVAVKSEGSVKSWESSSDLVSILKHEIRDGQLSLRGKHVLELGCGYGLPGIFACLKGASVVHFQDVSAETIRCTTVPNVLANLEQARERQDRHPESPLTPSQQALTSDIHFYAGEWEELATVLSIIQQDTSEPAHGLNLSFSEEDFMDGCSSHDGSIVGNETCSRRKLSSSRAWERASEVDKGNEGYDAILITEIPYSHHSLRKLYTLIKKCLRLPYGVLYVAAKKNLIGSNSGARQLRGLVDEEGIFGGHLLTEFNDREFWKFFYK